MIRARDRGLAPPRAIHCSQLVSHSSINQVIVVELTYWYKFRLRLIELNGVIDGGPREGRAETGCLVLPCSAHWRMQIVHWYRSWVERLVQPTRPRHIFLW